MISVTTPHNPTGTEIGEYAMGELCRLAELHGIVLLVDETYRDLGFHEPSTLAASLSGQAISICSMSKAYGIPGVRLGWLMTQNKYWQEVLLAAKEQICICNSVVDEEIGYQFLLGKDLFIAGIGKQTHENFRQLCDWMDHHAYLEWVKPTGGVVCFPRFREGTLPDAERFYHVLLNQYQTYVGPGHWFEQEMRYFRLGFGWKKRRPLWRAWKISTGPFGTAGARLPGYGDALGRAGLGGDGLGCNKSPRPGMLKIKASRNAVHIDDFSGKE
jgi:aspartate/methionine/tyrosine aminotransferase